MDMHRFHCRHCGFLVKPLLSPYPPHSLPWAKPQYRKSRQVVPAHQLLDVSLDVNNKKMFGFTEIKVIAVRDQVPGFGVEAVDLSVDNVSIDGKPALFRVETEQIFVILNRVLAKGQSALLRITYSVESPRAGLYFILPDKQFPNKLTHVYTQGQDDDARFWFPCFDDPGLKFSFEMKVRAPSGF